MINIYRLLFAGFAVTVLGAGFAASMLTIKDGAHTSGNGNTMTLASMPVYGFSPSATLPEGGGGGYTRRKPIVNVPENGNNSSSR